ncbi:MAG: helix-turn-helix domain-containing protein [Terrimicrobiaceae bacterium]
MKALFEKISLPSGEAFVCREYHVPRFTMPWHFHPECELTLIVRGRGTRFVGDSIARFNDGDLVLLGRNLPHYWWKDAEDRRRARSVVLQARAGFEDEAIFDLPEAAKIRDLFLFARRGLVFSGEVRDRVAEDLLRMKSVHGWERLCLLFEMLGQLADVKKPRFLASASFSPELGERDGRRLTAVCKYVNESYGERVRHDHAATLAGLSPAAFSRFFHRRMGKTFENYVTEVRIGHACRRLMEYDTSVLEIAFASGFSNLSNFNRHFLKFKGMTPRAYRKLTNHPAA